MQTSADSGAIIHCFDEKKVLAPRILIPSDLRTFLLADKTSVIVVYIGEVLIPFKNSILRLRQTLCLPPPGYNLVSTGCLADNGIQFYSRPFDVVLIHETSGNFAGCGNRGPKSKLYGFPALSLTYQAWLWYLTAPARTQICGIVS